MRERWEYAVMPSDVVVELLAAREAVRESADAFVSEDGISLRFDDLMKRGFRWVRTEHGQAVFERRVQQ